MKVRKSVSRPIRPAVSPAVSFSPSQKSAADFFGTGRVRWLTPVALFLIGLVVFFRFLTFRDVFLFKDIGSDTINQIYPYARMVADYFRESGFPNWSFRQGMGQYVAPFNTGSPFPYLLYLMSGEGVPYAMAYVEWLKFVMAGLVFYAYLRERGFHPFASLVGSLGYGYCGYLTIGSGWFTFFTAWPIQTAFLLFSLERLYQRNQWLWLPLAVALVAADQPFNLFLLAEFSLIYLLARLAADPAFSWIKTAGFVGKAFVMSLLGLLISSFFLSANLYAIVNSPRVTGGVSYVDLLSAQPVFRLVDRPQIATAVLRFFGNDLLGTGNDYRGWMNYMEGPTFYMGLLSLLLLPQAFWLANRRQRWVYGLLAGLVGLLLLFPFFRYAFWAFSGDYYRLLALFIGIGVLLAGVRVLDGLLRGQTLNMFLLAATVVLLLMLLFFPYNLLADRPRQTLTMLFLVAEAATLFWLNRQITAIGLWTLLLLVVVEVTVISYPTLNRREVVSAKEFRSRTGYNDFTREALAFIHAQDKGFYRIEKDYSSGPAMHVSLNDGMVQGYRGTSGYTAFNQKHTALFQAGMGLINPKNEVETRWLPGLRSRPLLMGLASVKYVLSKNHTPYGNWGFDSLTTREDVRIFRNPYALPMGFTYDRFITEEIFRQWSPVQKDFGVMRAFVIPGENKAGYPGLAEIRDTLAPADLNVDRFTSILTERRRDTLRLTSFSDNHFKGTIAPDRAKLLFLSIPFDEGWRAEVDGRETPTHLVTYGLTGLWLKPGPHTIGLRYEPPYRQARLMGTGLGVLLYLILFVISLKNKHITSLHSKNHA